MVAHISVSVPAARLRALRLTCAAQCNGAGGHHEGKVWRRRRRALGWAQGVCRAGRTVGGSTSRRDSWEGPADGNASSAPKKSSAPKNCVARKTLWVLPTFFEIRFKIKWLEKECIFQNFDQNKVHFNPNLGSKSSEFQASESNAVPPQSRRGLGKAGMAAQDAGRRGHHLPLPNLPQARWWHWRDLPRGSLEPGFFEFNSK